MYFLNSKGKESHNSVTEVLNFCYVDFLTNSILSSSIPLFKSEECLVMSIIFRLKRPLKHFVANKRGNGRLKDNAPNALSAELRTDVDNLAKFVLDSCNELLYEDDKQIVSLHITKIYDNDDICVGSTEVCLRSITTAMATESLAR